MKFGICSRKWTCSWARATQGRFSMWVKYCIFYFHFSRDEYDIFHYSILFCYPTIVTPFEEIVPCLGYFKKKIYLGIRRSVYPRPAAERRRIRELLRAFDGQRGVEAADEAVQHRACRNLDCRRSAEIPHWDSEGRTFILLENKLEVVTAISH